MVFLREAIWFGGALTYRVGGASIQSWVLWLQAVLSSSLGSDHDRTWVQSYIAFTCWCIWKARCEFVFNQVALNPSKVLFAISSTLDSFLGAVRVLEVRRPVVGAREVPVERWSPSPSHFSKINVDASWSKVSRLGFAGVIIRDEGCPFLAAARYSLLAPNAAAAKALALIRGCELGIAMGVSFAMIESDFLEAISCLRGSLDNGSCEAYPFLAWVIRLSESFQICR